ncbi:MAG: hypothetical protein JWM80_2839, partial [Cyanobacteria bacterium RYN_339]|nr:hypothetical protein [Cyanobacteria bacterium RYN_339]
TTATAAPVSFAEPSDDGQAILTWFGPEADADELSL